MEVFLLFVAGGAVAAAGISWVRTRRLHARVDKELAASELVAIRHLAEADAVQFGEELARLDARVSGVELDADTRTDYQAALDSYEAALRLVDGLRTLDDVSEVVDALAVGRYAVACVLARAEGAPLPVLRVPCFFDPRHGPASTEVLWTAPGHGTRKVPACAQDAARQAEGERPDVKMVRIDGQEVPYWAAGGLHQPYVNGYAPRTAREAGLDIRSRYMLENDPNRINGGGIFPT